MRKEVCIYCSDCSKVNSRLFKLCINASFMGCYGTYVSVMGQIYYLFDSYPAFLPKKGYPRWFDIPVTSCSSFLLSTRMERKLVLLDSGATLSVVLSTLTSCCSPGGIFPASRRCCRWQTWWDLFLQGKDSITESEPPSLSGVSGM